MSNTVIKIENLSKLYRLGVWGTGTLKDDLAKSWARLRGKSDPTATIGSVNTLDTVDQNLVWALKDINLEVKQGEVLGIIGKNGAGKSTLLKILSQITSPTSGSIKMKGRVASLLEVGTGMHQELTGRENIFLNGAILGMRKTEVASKFDEIVDFAGIAKYVDTPIKRYSSGMRVRLGFAIAAFLEPEILIVDEVLAVGDAEFQKKAIGKMQEISEGTGRTVLFVSHNMASVQNLCSRSVVLENGTEIFEGNTENAITTYLTNSLSQTKTDLRSITNRSGNGKVLLTSFHIEDINNNNIESVMSGDTFYLCFGVQSFSEEKMNMDLGFSIHNNNGDSLSVLYSSYQNNTFQLNSKAQYIIRCKIEDLPLEQGNYTIGARILSNGIETDWPKEKIGKIQIIKGDFYRTGNLGILGKSQFLIRGSWELQKIIQS